MRRVWIPSWAAGATGSGTTTPPPQDFISSWKVPGTASCRPSCTRSLRNSTRSRCAMLSDEKRG
ncbi:hypothetical protein D7V97_19320 [Corallococcus sp. CA053C]|nr:hypothetical protein D7V97_19320 [Corallococcus sp. CA053C]